MPGGKHQSKFVSYMNLKTPQGKDPQILKGKEKEEMDWFSGELIGLEYVEGEYDGRPLNKYRFVLADEEGKHSMEVSDGFQGMKVLNKVLKIVHEGDTMSPCKIGVSGQWVNVFGHFEDKESRRSEETWIKRGLYEYDSKTKTFKNKEKSSPAAIPISPKVNDWSPVITWFVEELKVANAKLHGETYEPQTSISTSKNQSQNSNSDTKELGIVDTVKAQSVKYKDLSKLKDAWGHVINYFNKNGGSEEDFIMIRGIWEQKAQDLGGNIECNRDGTIRDINGEDDLPF